MAMERLDASLVKRGIVETRSQAESYIKLGLVNVNGRPVRKAGFFVSDNHKVELMGNDKYVSRAGLKLASIATKFGLDFSDKTVLDVGSSTGGFTDYALQHGAKKVIAVDVGTDQMHHSLRKDPRIELHEKTDIREFVIGPSFHVDVVVIDVSFISLREIMPVIAKLSAKNTQIVAMVKPQFEAGKDEINKGIIKNAKIRRDILKDFEVWVKKAFVVMAKADSEVAGSKGNLERFYLLKSIRR